MMQHTPTKQPLKRVPKDVPQMTDAQKEALIKIPDLYSDPRSLVQIWRDAGVPYQEAIPPHENPNYQRNRRQTNGSGSGSQGSYSSPPYSNGSNGPLTQQSSALVPLGSAERQQPYQQQSYQNGGQRSSYQHPHQHTRVGSYGSPMKQQPPQQPIARPSSRMGNPATAFFAPGGQCQSTDLVVANGSVTNGHLRHLTAGSDSTSGSIGSGSVPPDGQLSSPAPSDTELELIFQNMALKRRVAQQGPQQQQQRKPSNNHRGRY